MKGDLKLDIRVDSKEATKKLNKAADAAERLRVALDDLREVKVGIEIVENTSKWWEFWK